MKKILLSLIALVSFSNSAYLFDYGSRLQCVDAYYYENKHYYLWYQESDTKNWVRMTAGDFPTVLDGYELKNGQCVKSSNDTFMMSLVGIFCGVLTLSGMVYLVLRVHR